MTDIRSGDLNGEGPQCADCGRNTLEGEPDPTDGVFYCYNCWDDFNAGKMAVLNELSILDEVEPEPVVHSTAFTPTTSSWTRKSQPGFAVTIF